MNTTFFLFSYIKIVACHDKLINMYKFVKPLLFSLNPELAHDLTLSLLRYAGDLGIVKALMPPHIKDPVNLLGCEFPNRVGLSAGLDKNASSVMGFVGLGFGFIEVGTVTPLPQNGNPKPRMFRINEYESIINRMGFNNNGLNALVDTLKKLRNNRLNIPIGINIGKNKNTPTSEAVNDYLTCLEGVAPYADYISINLSSPNTPNLRDLQFGEPLEKLLIALAQRRDELSESLNKHIPLLVKVAPDMLRDDLLNVADQLVRQNIDGIIATNTTIDKSSINKHPLSFESGGLSGEVLFERSTKIVSDLSSHLGDEIVIIGVGGINSPLHAVEKIKAGAHLVQLYSGLIYQGPSLIRNSAREIKNILNK